MKFIFSVFHYFSESESTDFIKKMRNFNFFCRDISDMYLDYLPVDKLLLRHNAKFMRLEIVLIFDLNKKDYHKIEADKEDIYITSITFFDINLFKKLGERFNKIYVSNEIYRNLLLLSLKNSWDIENELREINVKVNKTFFD